MIDFILSTIENQEQRNELADFYKKNRHRLYKIAFSKLHSREEAEDAIQEAFFCIADKPDKFFGIPQERRCSYTDVIVKNIACDMYKRKQKEQTVRINNQAVGTYYDISLPDIYIDVENVRELIGFIRSLSEAKKDVLLLRVLHQKSTAEIAEDLNISEDAVRRRLADARKLIKEFLERRNDND